MVDPKKPAKIAFTTTAEKPATVPTTNMTTRSPLPLLTPIPGEKSVAAADTATSKKVNQSASAAPQLNAASAEPSTPAEVNSKKATADSETTASATIEKPAEKLGPKLRKRDEILKALRSGARVERIDGLYRIVNADGTMNATSKRRIISLQNQKLLVASADGKTLTLAVEADAKAQVPKAPASTPTPVKPEPVTSPEPEAK
jgi:hypothetical protein